MLVALLIALRFDVFELLCIYTGANIAWAFAAVVLWYLHLVSVQNWTVHCNLADFWKSDENVMTVPAGKVHGCKVIAVSLFAEFAGVNKTKRAFDAVPYCSVQEWTSKQSYMICHHLSRALTTACSARHSYSGQQQLVAQHT